LPRAKGFSAKNDSQRRLAEAVDHHPICFAVGPAGTGKTHAAIALAVALHRQKYIHRIVIARPAVGAGESNGFLPGTIEEKLRPFMEPVLSCLTKVGQQTYSNASFVELVAFEHLRGRTFDDAFVIVDEAQNATFGQLEMVLTRLGDGSKMIVTGDPSQCDLRPGLAGLPTILHLLMGVEDIAIVQFEEVDNLRHPIVAELTKIFGTYHRTIHDSNLFSSQSYPAPGPRS
jgi:phosphate starvation-inducible protein PhoH and related proteins